jgi:hypothetical protein
MVDKYDLLELFEIEPNVIDEEAGIYRYKRTNEYGFTLVFYLSICEGRCILTLTYQDFIKPLYDMIFDNIQKIECSEDRLIINQENKSESIIVYFKPNYSLAFEERLQ